MHTQSSNVDKISITSDATTVWVNGMVNLGRFGRWAVDVHTDMDAQLNDGKHCADCWKRQPGQLDADWARFTKAMLDLHGVIVPNDLKPSR